MRIMDVRSEKKATFLYPEIPRKRQCHEIAWKK